MKGECLCGNVKFEIEEEIRNLYQCHCSLCRKATGAAANAATFVQGSQGGSSMRIRSCAAEDIEQAALIFCRAYAAEPYNEFWELSGASRLARLLVQSVNGGAGDGARSVAYKASGPAEWLFG
ncbi:GFA family protein [Marinobacter arenosus]|uniref:GFA family protein n=1 Tax=Marinobacter arenosus TaxID=2856822 RepID=UPI00406BB95E